MDEVEEKLRRIIQDIMGMDIAAVDYNKNLKEVQEWDSFNNLMIISEIESAFKIKFTAGDIYGVDTIAKILGLVRKKLGQKA
jgi:acyl carrier protein